MSPASNSQTTPAAPFVVEVGQARGGQIFHVFGETIAVKIAAADTAGRYTIVEETTPPLSGPPLHQHSREDEWFYILEGEYRFQVGDRFITAKAGDSLFGPRNTPHTFQNISNLPSRLLGLAEPAGMEAFFAELVQAGASGPPDPAQLLPIFHKYGLELLGPPLGSK